MRLTLRTLLAYLDDTLEPSQTKLIGQKVAESEIARQLVERIKDVTQRRRLTVPPTSGPEAQLDANDLAEYLDNTLPSERLAEVEETCLNSEVNLAEVSSCHQILTIVEELVGKPEKVPSPALRRMYTLSKSGESRRRAPAAAAVPASVPAAEEGDEALLMGLPPVLRRKPWLAWVASLASVVLLGAILGLAIWKSGMHEPPASEPLAVATAPTPAVDVRPPAEKTIEPPPATESKPAEPKPVEPKPAEPKPAEPTPTEAKPPVGKPAGSNDVKGPAEIKPPSTVRRETGRFVTVGSILLQSRGDMAGWTRVRPEAAVFSNDTLLSLPGYKSEIRMPSGVRITLWGTLPEQTRMMVLESAVVLHDTNTFDADLTLLRGRLSFTNHKPEGPATIRLRFKAETWDLTLQNGQTEVVAQLWGDDPINWGLSPSAPGEGPMAVLDLYALKGEAHLRDGYHSFALPSPSLYFWHSIRGTPQRPIPLPQLPDWAVNKGPLLQARVRMAQESLSRILTFKTSLDVALASALKDPELASRILAVFSMGAVDDLSDLGDALDDEAHPEVRYSAGFALRHWLHRGPEQEAKLEAAIKQKYQGSVQRKQILWLLKPLSEVDRAKPETYQLLIDLLASNNLPTRELAIQQLGAIVPHLAKEIPFDPAGGTEQRERAYKLWKAKVPDGKLPPPPSAK
jgi:hypothetical protein